MAGREWVREEGVTCVVCPDCAFTFDAVHEDTGGGYTCPNCTGGYFVTVAHDDLSVLLDGIHPGDIHDPATIEAGKRLRAVLVGNWPAYDRAKREG